MRCSVLKIEARLIRGHCVRIVFRVRRRKELPQLISESRKGLPDRADAGKG